MQVKWAKMLWIVTKRSFWQWPAVIVTGVCVLWAMGSGSWFPMLIWLIAEALFVSFKLQNEGFVDQTVRRQARLEREQESERLEERLHGLDIETRLRMRNICQLERDIADEILAGEHDELARSTLESSMQEIERLTDRAMKLAAKKRSLQRYLDSADEKSLVRQAEELRAKLESAEDEITREQYQQACAAKTREVEDYAAISRSALRIDGQLEHIECAFAGLKARTVRLKAAEATEWGEAGAQLESELQQLNVGVDALEGFVNEVLSVRHTGSS